MVHGNLWLYWPVQCSIFGKSQWVDLGLQGNPCFIYFNSIPSYCFKIATESQKNTAENLKKILADYKVMKKENIEMMKELKSSPSPSNRRKKKS